MSHALNKRCFIKLSGLNLRHLSLRSKNINEFGVQMLDEKVRSYLFGKKLQDRDGAKIDVAKEHLEKFDLLGKNVETLKDIDNIEIPKLKGNNIEEHFNVISKQYTEKYRSMLNSFSSSQLPVIPKEFEFTPGWTRYTEIINFE